MMIEKAKIQKPTEYDISFKYICQDCGCSHWLFMREVKAKGFKIICDCSKVIRPRRILDIDIIYEQKEKTKKRKPKLKPEKAPEPEVLVVVEEEETISPEPVHYEEPERISDHTMQYCMQTLISFGYGKEEAQSMINRSYEHIKENDCAKIIEYSLKNLGDSSCIIRLDQPHLMT